MKAILWTAAVAVALSAPVGYAFAQSAPETKSSTSMDKSGASTTDNNAVAADSSKKGKSHKSKKTDSSMSSGSK
jgi:hypothetical protein